jgi:chemotaxis protein CheD
MHIRKSSKYGKRVRVINAGEFYTSADNELIGTLLGSCVAVCLYDRVKRISGMNHFMLPGRISKADIFQDRSAKYGIVAMNKLLERLKELGAERGNIVAKIFGGGSVLEFERKIITIPDENVRLAKILLEMEDIPIAELDTGGKFTRKVMMDVQSGRVYLKKTTGREMLEMVHSEEVEYATRRFDA